MDATHRNAIATAQYRLACGLGVACVGVLGMPCRSACILSM